MTTPENPMTTADQRQNPTLAPSSGTDKAVTKNGPENAKVATVANSNLL